MYASIFKNYYDIEQNEYWNRVHSASWNFQESRTFSGMTLSGITKIFGIPHTSSCQRKWLNEPMTVLGALDNLLARTLSVGLSRRSSTTVWTICESKGTTTTTSALRRLCEDGLISLIQPRSISDSRTNPRNQQIVLSSKSSQSPNWLRSPRVSNRPYIQVQSKSIQTINKCKAIHTPNQTMNKAHSCSPSRQIYFFRSCPFVVIIIRDCTRRYYT